MKVKKTDEYWMLVELKSCVFMCDVLCKPNLVANSQNIGNMSLTVIHLSKTFTYHIFKVILWTFQTF